MSDRTINESTYREVVEAAAYVLKVLRNLRDHLRPYHADYDHADEEAVNDAVASLNRALATLQGLSPAQATDERALFEAWHATQHGRAFTGWVEAKGRYAWDLTQELWLCWQARAAIQAALPRGEEPPTLADARRYQWLRENKHYALLIGEEGFGYSYAQVEHWSNAQNAAKLDAAVDAARRGTPPLAPSVVAGEATNPEAKP